MLHGGDVFSGGHWTLLLMTSDLHLCYIVVSCFDWFLLYSGIFVCVRACARACGVLPDCIWSIQVMLATGKNSCTSLIK